MGADDIPEKLLASTMLEAVLPRLLVIDPPFREVFNPANLVIDEGLIADYRSDDAVASVGQRLDQTADTRLARDKHLAQVESPLGNPLTLGGRGYGGNGPIGPT